jgi:hypothetical protein
MISLNKKGVIILTHYRSGGTLLRSLIKDYIPDITNIGEIDFVEGTYDNDTKVDYKKFIKTVFEESKPNELKLIQLNNPLAISYLSGIDYFSYLNKNYHIIHLERKDIKKALLSLPLAEEKINFRKKHKDLSKEDLQKKFHDYLLLNKIPYTNIYTGIHFDTPNNENYRNYLDYQLMLLTNRLHLNRYLQNKYNLFSLTYEDFESEPKEPFYKLFSIIQPNRDKLATQLRFHQRHGKQQYINTDYLDYFDDKVKKVFEYWNIL